MHRDIRPENVLVTPEGPIALSSFHFATQHHDGCDKLTEGFPATGFLAPEMVSARRTKYGYDGTSDVWAFGMVMLDMITGQVNVSAVSSEDLERYNLMIFFFLSHILLCRRAMPYDPHLLASWSQFYEAILSAPPPRYAENEWAGVSSAVFGTPPPKAQVR